MRNIKKAIGGRMQILLGFFLMLFFIPTLSRVYCSDWLDEAIRSYKVAEFGRAIRLVNENLYIQDVTDSEKVLAYKYLAFSYIALGKFQDAKRSFEMMLYLNPLAEIEASPKIEKFFEEVRKKLMTTVFIHTIPEAKLKVIAEDAFESREVGFTNEMIQIVKGNYLFILSNGSYKQETLYVDLLSSNKREFTVNLQKLKGFLYVKTYPDSAKVQLSPGYGLFSPCFAVLDVGKYNLRISKFPLYRDTSLTVSISGFDTTYLYVLLNRNAEFFSFRDSLRNMWLRQRQRQIKTAKYLRLSSLLTAIAASISIYLRNGYRDFAKTKEDPFERLDFEDKASLFNGLGIGLFVSTAGLLAISMLIQFGHSEPNYAKEYMKSRRS